MLDEKHIIHQEGHIAKAVFQGGMIVLIAHIQVYIHNVYLYKKYFSINTLKYITGIIFLFISYFLINYFTPFRFVRSEEPVTMGISIFLVYLVGLGFYYAHKNILERNLLFKSEIIERDEEIRHLKAQLNPHFLFNALNNLYGTALTDPKETPDKILELSDLLRYQIESSKKEHVTLDDEIQFIRKYLSYEQNRNPKLKIDFETDEWINRVSISPMLFMPFIENAIKYSAHTDKPFCFLSIKTDKKTLFFKMRNNFTLERRKFSGTNTGILNTKKRLELTYKNKHQLVIEDKNEIYTVELTIKL
ncbi:sensor histidine kinase [Aurantibacillus circumpalustris]|uniref:sensor histidine kinase n=1 Tax=Aurantibacillus circumpalustris TaxID=3036359 RepID=UPI00295AC19D|nr:histidine kinase [Aurantibacillus circumpalustris]